MKQVVINTLWIGGVLLMALFLLHTKITWKPFSIQFENWRTVLGIILIFVGVEVIVYDEVRKYKNKVVEIIKQELHETTSDTVPDRQTHGEESRQD